MKPRRMTKHLSLVLLTTLPGLAGCGGCTGRERTQEIEEWVAEPPPEGPEHLVGAPFIVWWDGTHPPTLVKRIVPASVAAAQSTYGSHSSYYRPNYYRPYYGGRSSFLSSSLASGSHSSSSSHSSGSISHGGFGSSGHSAGGSSSS